MWALCDQAMDDCADPLEYGRREYAIEVGYITRPSPPAKSEPPTRPLLQALKAGMLDDNIVPEVDESMRTANQPRQA